MAPTHSAHLTYPKSHQFTPFSQVYRPIHATASESSSDIEVTLDGMSNDINVNAVTQAEFTMQSKESSDIDSQDELDTNTNYLRKPLGNFYEEHPDYSRQPPRPRFSDGFGAIDRHLNGHRSSRDLKPAEPITIFGQADQAKAYGHVKGFVTPPLEADVRSPLAPTPSTYLRTAEQSHTSLQPSAHASRTIPRPRAVLPDLSQFATAEHIASVIASTPRQSRSDGLPVTQPFSLYGPGYTDDDIPLPQPYNTEYPHPLTAYASPQVNPNVVKKSGYGQLLQLLVQNNLPLTLGSRLYNAGFRDLESSVYLMFSFGASQGNGIPEALWSKLENSTTTNSSRLPVGIAGVSPFARPSATVGEVPPRFAQAQAAMQYGMLTPPESTFDHDYFSKYTPPRSDPDYDPTPRPSPEFYRSIRHASSTGHIGSPLQNWESHNRNGTSPFYKTELCAIWQQVGTCNYGTNCQYAHGSEELRLPRHLQNAVRRSNNPDRVITRSPQSFETFDGVSYLKPAKSVSLQSHTRFEPMTIQNNTSRYHKVIEPRRASCPPQRLLALSGIEGSNSDSASATRSQLSAGIPPPIGAERSTTNIVSGTNTPFSRQSIPSTEKWEDMPAFNLADSSYSQSSAIGSTSTQLRSEPSTMSRSLSTSSSGDYSLFSQYSEDFASKPFFPINEDLIITNNDFGNGKPRNVMESNNGQSIW
ncbi:uncharacterized protein I206_107232 [Kwoniella pini CBS 10737]|uniref:C3H1-type domain-containing protein n=1 Tax=Kwoniella pini CBS 10737 TaxID=1296096 RepID=A0A1B9HYU1_9TREE|nr:uncharacterized protein I206_05223 [Kwoniella pini CBS 10737]OCF48445.1 hypothetical protein I206_05223 [Kwoniella pini CBS 10737]